MNILIVDDREDNLYMLESLLRASGHHVLKARNGVEALEVLSKENVGLIITDILMPVMDGFQLCRQIKTDEALKAIPLIIYTATYTGNQDEAFAMKIGADRFLEKPCEPEVLISTVNELIDEAEIGGGISSPQPVEEAEALKLYSERLVRKLEQKVFEAEQEIKARKAAENALRESEARLIAAQRLSRTGDFVWDVETGEVTWSAGLYDVIGYHPNEKIDFAKVDKEMHHPDDRDEIIKWLNDAIESGGDDLPPHEYRVIRKDGTVIFARTLGTIKRPIGRMPQIFATLQDITERRSADALLRESEAKFRLFAETAPVGVIIASKHQEAIYVSPKFTALFGYTLEDIPDIQTWYSRAYPDPALRQRVEAAWQIAIEQAKRSGSEITPVEFPVTCRDGGVRDVEFRMSTSGDLDFIVVTDITARKRSEAEQEKLRNQLFQAQKLETVGRLAGGVAHDFNNILSVIIGYTEISLDEPNLSDYVRQNLHEVHTAALRSTEITRQLLAFASKQTIAPQVLDLNLSINGMRKMLARLIGEDIDLIWKPAPEACTVKMDPSQIDQVLVNLCINARDAIANVGKIIITTKLVSFDDAYCKVHDDYVPGDYVNLSVEDDGCGMDGRVLENLFEPFFTTKETGKGTGLGLCTVYGIMKQNGGFIIVDSEVGKGTTFNLYIPRHEGQPTPVSNATDTDIPHGNQEVILFVEDEAANLRLGKAFLEQLGYVVVPARSPIEAIELAKEHSQRIQLLITDVVMPQMNGKDLAMKLTGIFPLIKTIYVSGYSADVIAHQGIIDEGVNFVQKPYSIRDLAVRIRSTLDA